MRTIDRFAVMRLCALGLGLALAGCAGTGDGMTAATAPPPPNLAAVTPPSAPAASAANAMPDPGCIKLLDELTAKVPPDESLAAWRRKGLRLSKPLLVMRTEAFAPKEHTGVVVRMEIGQNGRAILGTAQVLETVGDPRLAAAMPTAIQGIQFDYTGLFKPPARFTFTTSYVACAE